MEVLHKINRKIKTFRMYLGDEPIGIVLGPEEYLTLKEQLFQCLGPEKPKEVSSTKEELFVLGLPVRLVPTPGVVEVECRLELAYAICAGRGTLAVGRDDF